jgi:hypothetical protein
MNLFVIESSYLFGHAASGVTALVIFLSTASGIFLSCCIFKKENIEE